MPAARAAAIHERIMELPDPYDTVIVERGTHEELLAHGGLYARLYHEQFRDMPVGEEALAGSS